MAPLSEGEKKKSTPEKKRKRERLLNCYLIMQPS